MMRTLASIGAISIVFMAVPGTAQALGRGMVAQERLIAHCIHQSARGKPWLVKTLWALRDQEGGWIGAEVRNRDGSYDLGPMQINSQWVPRMARLVGRRSDEIQNRLRYDACFNVEAARWLLLTNLAASSDYWQAVGAYHSPTPVRRHCYAISVARRLARHLAASPMQTSFR